MKQKNHTHKTFEDFEEQLSKNMERVNQTALKSAGK